MTKPRAVLAALCIVVATAPACSRGSGTSAVPFVAVDPHSTSLTDQAIAKAQQKLRANKGDATAQLNLAQAFLQKARETADPTYYGKAATLLKRLDGASPDNLQVLVSQGSLALSQHRFTDALALGTRAAKIAPDNEGVLGVLVDANNELGHYPPALEATDRMVTTKPNLASLSRASYARELRGDLRGAIVAMTQAVTAGGGGGGENLAYVQVLLGNLLVTQGDLVQAGRIYAAAEQSFPGFPAAKAGRARIMVAQQRYREAAQLYDEVVRVQPLSEYAIAKGDALRAAGQPTEAQKAYALVDAIAKLYRANGVNVDLELALFDADHRPGPDNVSAARKAVKERPSILGHDVLSWALFKDHKVDEAAIESNAALATGSHDPLLRYHAAAIADAHGDAAGAKADLQVVLDTQPRFSSYLTKDIEKLAAKLGLPMPPVPAA